MFTPSPEVRIHYVSPKMKMDDFSAHERTQSATLTSNNNFSLSNNYSQSYFNLLKCQQILGNNLPTKPPRFVYNYGKSLSKSSAAHVSYTTDPGAQLDSNREIKKYIPKIYQFIMPGNEAHNFVKVPPFWLLLDHTIAILWILFSSTPRSFFHSQLQWALIFLKRLSHWDGTFPEAIARGIYVIQITIEDPCRIRTSASIKKAEEKEFGRHSERMVKNTSSCSFDQLKTLTTIEVPETSKVPLTNCSSTLCTQRNSCSTNNSESLEHKLQPISKENNLTSSVNRKDSSLSDTLLKKSSPLTSVIANSNRSDLFSVSSSGSTISTFSIIVSSATAKTDKHESDRTGLTLECERTGKKGCLTEHYKELGLSKRSIKENMLTRNLNLTESSVSSSDNECDIRKESDLSTHVGSSEGFSIVVSLSSSGTNYTKLKGSPEERLATLYGLRKSSILRLQEDIKKLMQIERRICELDPKFHPLLQQGDEECINTFVEANM